MPRFWPNIFFLNFCFCHTTFKNCQDQKNFNLTQHFLHLLSRFKPKILPSFHEMIKIKSCRTPSGFSHPHILGPNAQGQTKAQTKNVSWKIEIILAEVVLNCKIPWNKESKKELERPFRIGISWYNLHIVWPNNTFCKHLNNACSIRRWLASCTFWSLFLFYFCFIGMGEMLLWRNITSYCQHQQRPWKKKQCL